MTPRTRAATAAFATALALSSFAGRAAAQEAEPADPPADEEAPPDAPFDEIDLDALDDAPAFGARAVVRAPPPPTTSTEDPTASGTVVPVDDRVSPAESAQELLYEVPGTRVVETGATGSFAGVALRGAELAHTTVLLDTIPLSGPDTGTFNLSLLPTAALERLEVYRGGAPVRFGDGAIGGVVRVVPKAPDGPAAGVDLGYGSYDTLRLDGFVSVGDDDLGSLAILGVRRTDGDFPYLDDGGTRFVPEDDVERRRQNADSLQAHGLLRVRARAGEGHLDLVGVGLSRIGGEPGPASSPALRTRRHVTRGLVGLGYSLEGGTDHPYRLALSVAGGHERNQLADRYGELGLIPKVTDDRAFGGYVRGAFSVVATDWLEPTVVLTARYDRYTPDNLYGPATPPPSDRVVPAAALETRLHARVEGWRFELRPSVRVAYSVATIHGPQEDRGEEAGVDAFVPTFRVGALVSPLPFLSVVGAFFTGRRLPSILELFGDRGVLSPNPTLAPERSVGVDAGVVLKNEEGPVRGWLEARFFYLSVDDLIRYRRTAQFTAVAENIASGESLGLEAGLRGEVTDHVALASAITVLEARDDLGRALPFRPQVQVQVTPELHSGPLGAAVADVALGLSVVHVGANFVDAANLVELPARTWLGLSVRGELHQAGLYLAATVRDLLDARGSDLLGYPLPGRRFEVVVGGRLGGP